MRRLRPTDGTAVHRKAARYHMARCLKGGAPLHADLRTEMIGKYTYLKTKAREVEDAEDDAVEAGAEVDSAEIALENVIRDLDGDLAKRDRDDPSLNAQRTVFPDGFGKEIDPDGESQLAVLPPLRTRLTAFQSTPGVAEGIAKFDKAESAFRAALDAEEEASTKVDTLFEEEQAGRRAIREQIESAYGRLRDLYKSRPSLAEDFFLKEGSRRNPEKKPE